jgi:hypothetical protein
MCHLILFSQQNSRNSMIFPFVLMGNKAKKQMHCSLTMEPQLIHANNKKIMIVQGLKTYPLTLALYI